VINRSLSLSVRIFYTFITVFIFLSISPSVAQVDDGAVPLRRGSKIIDDSTKNIYGPNTSHYYYQDDFFFNRNLRYTIDTSAWNFHRFNYVQRYNNFHQDLGNIGTAIQPIYNQVSEKIGANTGFNAYNLYWDDESIRYFDTKSPYSNMKIIIGGKGRAVTRVTFSRNITPRWNFGMSYRALLIDKQVQRQGKGDRNVRSTYYDLYSVFHTKDSTYSVFVNYRKNTQQVNEYGGVLVGDYYQYSDFFLDNAQPNLTDATSDDKQSDYSLFHQFKPGSGLQVYHKADFYKQRNRFYDNDPDTTYYDVTIIDSAKTSDQFDFRTLRNEIGIKGNLLKLFYNGYVAVRHFDVDYKYIDESNFYLDTSDDELYLGGRMELQVDSLIEVKGWVEWMMDERYQIRGSIRTKWFEASVKRSVSTPAYLQQAYRASHDLWLNSFTNVEASEIKGNLIYQSKRIAIYPGIRFSTFRNYIFFKQDTSNAQHVLPIQSSGYQTWVSPELNLSFTVARHINFIGQALYTTVLENSEDAIQVPEMFINAQLSYSNIWFNGNMDFQTGVDVHWKSAYYAPGYDPVIQQFYQQRDFVSPSFPIVDVFLNIKIKRARVFVKYNNLLMLFSSYGNIPTPYYPGIRNLIDFGFDWSFYN
jgi:Putative porin